MNDAADMSTRQLVWITTSYLLVIFILVNFVVRIACCPMPSGQCHLHPKHKPKESKQSFPLAGRKK